MFKETDENGQYNMDCRLDHEISMDQNTMSFIEFATNVRKTAVGNEKVRNRFEGYGLLADAHQNLVRSNKAVKDAMGELLDALQLDDAQAVDKVSNIEQALVLCVTAAAEMAAEAKRVSFDLYQEGWGIGSDIASDDDGFSDPEE